MTLWLWPALMIGVAVVLVVVFAIVDAAVRRYQADQFERRLRQMAKKHWDEYGGER